MVYLYNYRMCVGEYMDKQSGIGKLWRGIQHVVKSPLRNSNLVSKGVGVADRAASSRLGRAALYPGAKIDQLGEKFINTGLGKHFRRADDLRLGKPDPVTRIAKYVTNTPPNKHVNALRALTRGVTTGPAVLPGKWDGRFRKLLLSGTVGAGGYGGYKGYQGYQDFKGSMQEVSKDMLSRATSEEERELARGVGNVGPLDLVTSGSANQAANVLKYRLLGSEPNFGNNRQAAERWKVYRDNAPTLGGDKSSMMGSWRSNPWKGLAAVASGGFAENLGNQLASDGEHMQNLYRNNPRALFNNNILPTTQESQNMLHHFSDALNVTPRTGMVGGINAGRNLLGQASAYPRQ